MAITSDEAQIELVEIVGQFVAASNLTVLATDAAGAKWVYKAESAMSELWDFEATTLPRREVAAYRLSEALGFGLIPTTLLAIGPLGPGSAQRFVEADPDFDVRPLFVPEISDDLWPLAVLDVLSNNADRKLGHLLREDGRLWAIDNGLTFHAHPKLRTVLWGLAGRRIPQTVLAQVADLAERLDSDLGFGPLLDESSLSALHARVRSLLATGVHPDPPTDRPAVPWPIW